MFFFKASTATAAAGLGIRAGRVVFGIAGWVRFFEFRHRMYCCVFVSGEAINGTRTVKAREKGGDYTCSSVELYVVS